MVDPSHAGGDQNQAPARTNGWRIRAVFLALLLCRGARAQERRELVNRSGQPWLLALVEGTRAGVGTMTCVDKFTGRPLAELARTGDRAIIPAHARVLLGFARSGGGFFRGFILEDGQGHYAEYAASVDYLSSPEVTVQLVDQHLGPPLDQGDGMAVRQFVQDAIEWTGASVIIHLDALGGSVPGTVTAAPAAGDPRSGGR